MDKDLQKRAELFSRAYQEMIATSDYSYNHKYGKQTSPIRKYTKEEVENIVSGSSLEAIRKLSRDYFNGNGFYKRIVLYYATLLKYIGILIPYTNNGTSVKAPAVNKKYYSALRYVEKMRLKELLYNFSLRALVDGSYYGVIQQVDKQVFSVIDLPVDYCRTRFKDAFGKPILEFNILYFDYISDPEDRKKCLKVYPSVFKRFYEQYKNGKHSNYWMFVPSDISICFSLLDSERPFFLSIIPAILDYDDAVEIDKAQQEDKVKKILINHMPHLTDGSLVFEPDEAKVFHDGAVQMLKDNKFLSVYTSYADVDVVSSKTTADNTTNNIDKMVMNIYNEAGTSKELFSSNSNLALKYSLANDTSLMMVLANKYSTFITQILNSLYGNSFLSFSYSILPISYYNEKDNLDLYFKLASSGYSLLLPALCVGIGQSELMGLKDLENNVLNLNEILKPLSSSYTQSAKQQESNPVGRQKKPDEEKTEKTVMNETALEKQGMNANGNN